ncbi:MAG: aldehyde:ferredoxin oxidoreductase, partial [Deltaproteobacteria bacterium]|nr:aldehyde:ferredoxin oxidoreductase [Deltaproteobacteria bacterium]
AGENLVRFAVIENDHWRSAGRTGIGTVMGAKKLKAVMFEGDRRRPLYDEKAVRAFSKELAAESKTNKGVEAYRTLGTPQMVRVMNQANAFPSRYWSQGRCEHWESIGADALHERCRVRPNACLKCFMACGRMTEVLRGRHAGLRLEGPEYETIYAFGGLCLIDSIEEIAHLNDLCDRLGMDTITAGNLCAFTIEAVRRGKVRHPIEYGDAEGAARLLRMIAAREGIGDLLAGGIRTAAAEWGLEDIAVHVKGLEPAGYDPRILKGMGLAYATSDRGACHLRTTFYKAELSGMIPPARVEGKAELLIEFEDRLNLFDMLILCRFYRDLYPWDRLREMIHAVTGQEESEERLREMAGSLTTLIRGFNLREGLRAEDDLLPKCLYRERGPSEEELTEEELRFMVGDYYRIRGWDEEGRPPLEEKNM